MVVDPRRDHSIRIPRPDLTVTLGVPNACNHCHEDRDAAWAAEQTARWHGAPGAGQQDWAEAFAAARAGDPRSERMLVDLVEDVDTPDIARATALLELRAFLSPSSADTLQRGLADPSPLVRIAALRGLEALPPPQRYPFAEALLQDPLRAVRIEAARVLAGVSEETLATGQRLALRRALGEYVQSQELNADRADARTNLGNLFQQRGDLTRAESEFRRAIELDPLFPVSYVNLADLYRLQRRDQAAANVLAEGLARLPESAALHHALGLLQVRGGDMDGALSSLGAAARLDPQEPRFAYVYGVALNSAGRAEAVPVLRRALQRHPYDRDILFALVTMLRDGGEIAQAQSLARRMLEIRPDDVQARQLLDTLR